MYKDFYGLSTKPFSKTPDPHFFYQSKAHREALARMEYAVEERELMVLTGEIGAGKTTLSRTLVDCLDSTYKAVLIINPWLSPNQFLTVIANGIGIKEPNNYKHTLLKQIYY